MMRTHNPEIRLGADIGGTFTDIALAIDGQIQSIKVLTDHNALEAAVVDGILKVTSLAAIAPQEIGQIIHGTTLATNALIERRGAKTALITTDGFRDVIEMRTESRFDQYDLNLQLNPALIPRQHRYTVKGRMDAHGKELQALDEPAVEHLATIISTQEFESVAIGLIHSYANPTHELRVREILASRLPNVSISISAEISPQMREYPRFCTVCANAYIRPKIERYLTQLQTKLNAQGVTCPVYMIHSAGGLISVDTAKDFPVRLVESGPAGGAMFAADMAAKFGLDKVVSFDMGGTTAKICLIEDSQPRTSREFEVARSQRFCKGSGMPLSIPVIDMIEIGAGGGSIAWIDSMKRIQIGPQSAGSDPGPACYQRGGQQPTVTDADLILGKIDPDRFAEGTIQLSDSAATLAISESLGKALSSDVTTAAFGICEVVDENMANAARVHAVENGSDISDHVMIAFGGAAPLHAARICEKLNIDSCLIPRGAGVGSAIGFLIAPFSYEAVESRVMSLNKFQVETVNQRLADLIEKAENFVRAGTQAKVSLEVTAFMRYQGQGWEIPVPITIHKLTLDDVPRLKAHFEQCYEEFFGRKIDILDDLDIEVVSWSVKVSEEKSKPSSVTMTKVGNKMHPLESRTVFDPASGQMKKNGIVDRMDLVVGERIIGPAIIVEQQTSTVVTSRFDAVLQSDGSILLMRKSG